MRRRRTWYKEEAAVVRERERERELTFQRIMAK
jgi:hypothetical protein